MKDQKKIIDMLNTLLTEELTSINQYIVHAEMCEDWGYSKLHGAQHKRAIEEMKHAEQLIERILFLKGVPAISSLSTIMIGDTVENQHENDKKAEDVAISLYNEGIQLAADQGDNGTKMLLEEILKEEEEHVDWIESQLDQVEQMGIQQYLNVQIRN